MIKLSLDPTAVATPSTCSRCGTELPSAALACPACAALVHSVRLKELAAKAEAATAAGQLADARVLWNEALTYVPPTSQQHAAITAKLAAIPDPDLTVAGVSRRPGSDSSSWRGRIVGGAVFAALLLFSKLKFLLLGLTKVSTFVSMFAFFGVYWSLYGWPLALGIAVTIYIHEMGHVAMLRRLGIQSGAPLFVPGIGALVMLKQHVSDPSVDARIGLAGPRWGLAAAAAALVVYYVTGAEIWFAIAQLTAWVNLFNLTPIWQLDGSRGFHALNRQERWLIVAVILIMLMITSQSLLLIVGAVALYRALTGAAGPGDRRALATFAALVLCLSWLARGVR